MSDTTDSSTLARLRSTVQRTIANSSAVALVRHLETTVTDSRARAFVDRFAEYTRASFLYRWLTKEPDPEVVVIDLRETYTVGPVIELLDRGIRRTAAFEERLAPYWYGSTINRVFDWILAQIHRALDTRAGRMLRALLEPPEPPDDDP